MDQYRKSPRASWLEYNEGIYFVTVCTRNRIHFFGRIQDGEMILSEIGMILGKELANPKEHHKHIDIPAYVVMPNHFHAVVVVSTPVDKPFSVHNLPKDKTSRSLAGYQLAKDGEIKNKRTNTLLGTYIGSLKSAVTRMAHQIDPKFGWQKRYHDAAIRNTRMATNISEYIDNNVIRWEQDCFYNRL